MFRSANTLSTERIRLPLPELYPVALAIAERHESSVLSPFLSFLIFSLSMFLNTPSLKALLSGLCVASNDKSHHNSNPLPFHKHQGREYVPVRRYWKCGLGRFQELPGLRRWQTACRTTYIIGSEPGLTDLLVLIVLGIIWNQPFHLHADLNTGSAVKTLSC